MENDNMYTEFYKDRPYIENEYEDGQWIEESGKAPDELNVEMRSFLKENPDMPGPLQIANLYRIMLTEMQIGINEHSMFPDRMRHGGKYTTDATPSLIEFIQREKYEKTFLRKCHAVWSQRMMLAQCGLTIPDTDVWHTVLDWQDVIDLGACGLLERAYREKAKKESEGSLTGEQAIFYDSVIITYEAVIAYI
jgi:hypothetical protein